MQINQKQLPFPNNITVSFPKIQGHAIVTWNPVKQPEDKHILAVAYNVYRGTSVKGIFYKQNPKPLISNAFEDSTRGNHPNTMYWYKVSTMYITDEGEWVEGPISTPVTYKVNNTNRWFNKINERNMWILKNTGQLFDLYTIKTTGPKCPKCYSEEHGRAANPDCLCCFGTGFEGGYEPVYQLYVRQKPAQQTLDIGSTGLRVNNPAGAWTISSTQIKNRDILINPQGQIFQVTGAHINHAAGYYFHQELQMKELPVTDPLYKMNRIGLYPMI